MTTWERDWELLTGWKRWLVVAGAVHASFTDLALLADQTGIDIGAACPEPGPWTSPAPTSGPSSTSTCAAGRKPVLSDAIVSNSPAPCYGAENRPAGRARRRG